MGLLDALFGKNHDGEDDDIEYEAEKDREEEEHGVTEDSEEDKQWIGALTKKRRAEIEQDSSDFGKGAAGARMEIDDMRRYYRQYGYSSFQQAVETASAGWYREVQTLEDLVEQGHTEYQSRLDNARGFLSMYD
jgi:hypothetical protein